MNGDHIHGWRDDCRCSSSADAGFCARVQTCMRRQAGYFASLPSSTALATMVSSLDPRLLSSNPRLADGLVGVKVTVKLPATSVDGYLLRVEPRGRSLTLLSSDSKGHQHILFAIMRHVLAITCDDADRLTAEVLQRLSQVPNLLSA